MLFFLKKQSITVPKSILPQLQHLIYYSSLPSSSTTFPTQVYHSHLTKTGSAELLHVINYLLSRYVKNYDLKNARKLFDDIPQRDVRTWTILISGFTRYHHYHVALEYFAKMRNEGIVAPNAFTLSSVFKCCASVNNGLQMGKATHGWMIINGIEMDVALHNSILDLYAKCGLFDYVKRLFELMSVKDSTSWNIMLAAKLSEGEMGKCLGFFNSLPIKSVSSWNTIIDGLLQHGFERNALERLYEMVKIGPCFNEVTFSISLALASVLKSLELGRQIHSQLMRVGLHEDSFAITSLIGMYCKCWKMNKASTIFQEFRQKCNESSLHDNLMAKTISWSTIIAGYVHNGMMKDAIECFTSMVHEQVEVDIYTLTSILAASANAASLELGEQIHACVVQLGHVTDVCLCSAIVDMYAKCGKLDEAFLFFTHTKTRNVVLWSAMISSHAIHGMGKEALELFELMQKEGVTPNGVSFVGLLTACNHTGLVKQGSKYFKMMVEVYHIQPVVEHFACMVDLFGRAGRLKESEDFILKNGISHLKEVWKAFLSSCWLHNNIELANSISKKLIELDPQESDSYVLLSNTYSAHHSWAEAAQLRHLMQEREVKKLPDTNFLISKRKLEFEDLSSLFTYAFPLSILYSVLTQSHLPTPLPHRLSEISKSEVGLDSYRRPISAIIVEHNLQRQPLVMATSTPSSLSNWARPWSDDTEKSSPRTR